MKINLDSPFILHDFLCTYLARWYSNEQHRPMLVSIGDFDGYDISSMDGDIRLFVKEIFKVLDTSSGPNNATNKGANPDTLSTTPK